MLLAFLSFIKDEIIRRIRRRRSVRVHYNFIKIFSQVLVVLFIVILLALTYFLAYYAFHFESPVNSSTNPVHIINRVKINSSHLPQLVSKTTIAPSASKVTRTTPSASSNYSNNDTFGVYFESFSNSFYINPNQTTLYHDQTATAIMFTPVYSWSKAGSFLSLVQKHFFQIPSINNFKGPYYDRRCLGNNCLVQKDNSLYYNGHIINLPSVLKSNNLLALSIAVLNQRWLVGATLKNGKKYQGLVFYFNGSKFIPISTPQAVISPYFGLWGFGGSDNDFLMIYGAYKGIAYRVRGNTINNISRFFDIRAMNGGFKAEVIRSVFGSRVNWYIYSTTLNHPRFFKLWQDDSNQIAGEVFFNNIFSNSTQSATFQLLKIQADSIRLLARTKTTDGHLTDMIFTDQGFNNTSQGVLTTNALGNKMIPYKIAIQRIFDVNLGLNYASQKTVKYLFSDNDRDWQSLIGRQRSNFISPATPFYLRIIFPAETNRFYSPYLNSMLFSYYWKKV